MFLKKSRFQTVLLSLLTTASVVVVCPHPAEARIIEQAQITTMPDGYELTLFFPLYQFQERMHTPDREGGSLRIQLQLNNAATMSPTLFASLAASESVPWDKSTGIPLNSIWFDGIDPARPEIALSFRKHVTFDIRSSADLRSLIVRVYTQPAGMRGGRPSEILTTADIRDSSAGGKTGELMASAKRAMLDKNYSKAIELYEDVLDSTSTGDTRKMALEYVAMAYERSGKLADAQEYYEHFLKEYPRGDDSDRVMQRLAGILTASDDPKKLRDTTLSPDSSRAGGRPKLVVGDGKGEGTEWTSNYFGGFAQTFYYDRTKIKNLTTSVNRKDVVSDANVTARWSNKDMEYGARFSGNYVSPFKEDDSPQDSIDNLTFSFNDKQKGYSGIIGRQSVTSGGVLGRFDGFKGTYKLSPTRKINLVAGYPVEPGDHAHLQTDRSFVGVNADLGPYYNKKWNFNVFAINQKNDGYTDRTAVGGEARYFDNKKSFFGVADYDIHYGSMNILMLNGQWQLTRKDRLNANLDYRNSPILTTTNAISGQGVVHLRDLKDRFSTSEIEQLAQDRAAKSTTLSAGLTHEMNPDWQVSADVAGNTVGATPASGGIPASEATGPEITYSAQSVNSNILKEGDSYITTVSLADLENYDNYSASVNARIPLAEKVKVSPRMRIDHRKSKKANIPDAYIFSPAIRADYTMETWATFESEAALTRTDESGGGSPLDMDELFFSLGYRLDF